MKYENPVIYGWLKKSTTIFIFVRFKIAKENPVAGSSYRHRWITTLLSAQGA